MSTHNNVDSQPSGASEGDSRVTPSSTTLLVEHLKAHMLVVLQSTATSSTMEEYFETLGTTLQDYILDGDLEESEHRFDDLPAVAGEVQDADQVAPLKERNAAANRDAFSEEHFRQDIDDLERENEKTNEELERLKEDFSSLRDSINRCIKEKEERANKHTALVKLILDSMKKRPKSDTPISDYYNIVHGRRARIDHLEWTTSMEAFHGDNTFGRTIFDNLDLGALGISDDMLRDVGLYDFAHGEEGLN